MKRTPLTRKTPLTSHSRLRRTKLRARSDKQKAMYAEHGPAREAYLQNHTICVVCGRPYADTIHEISGGADRSKTFGDKAYWLACHYFNCHVPELQHNTTRAKQWALKLIHDMENFDGRVLSEIPGKRCSVKEVIEALRESING